MIAFYPYVIAALLFIFSHSTNQSTFNTALYFIEKEVHSERTISKYTRVTLARAFAHELPSDIVCDTLNDEDKKSLCDEAMVHRINKYHGGAGGEFVTFLPTESDLEVPKLAKTRVPYACKEILVVADQMDMKRDMYWCGPKRYKITISNESLQSGGFFISGSRKFVDKVFLFEPPQPHSEVVTAVGKLESVELLSEKAKTLARYASSPEED